MMISSYLAAAIVTERQREREQSAARYRLARLARPNHGGAARQAGLTTSATAAVASRLAIPAGRASPGGDCPAGCAA